MHSFVYCLAIIVCLLATSSLSSSLYVFNGTRVTNGLISLYTFTEGQSNSSSLARQAFDQSGANTFGPITISNSSLSASWSFGRAGLYMPAIGNQTRAISANNATQFLSLVAASAALTVEAWFTPNTTGGNGIIFGIGNWTEGQYDSGSCVSANTASNLVVMYNNSLVYCHFLSSVSGRCISLFASVSGLPFPLHVVCSLGSASLNLYVNGHLGSFASAPLSFTYWNSQSWLSIGQASIAPGGSTWSGNVWLIAFYNQAINQSEVLSNYYANIPRNSPTITVGRQLFVQETLNPADPFPVLLVGLNVSYQCADTLYPVTVYVTSVPAIGFLYNASVISTSYVLVQYATIWYQPPAYASGLSTFNLAANNGYNDGPATVIEIAMLLPAVPSTTQQSSFANSSALVTFSASNPNSAFSSTALLFSIVSLPQEGLLYQTSDGEQLGSEISAFAGMDILYTDSIGFIASIMYLNITVSSTPAFVSVKVLNPLSANSLWLNMSFSVQNKSSAIPVVLSGSSANNASLTFFILSLPVIGQLQLSSFGGQVISSGPFTLPSSDVYYLPNPYPYSDTAFSYHLNLNDAFTYASGDTSGLLSTSADVSISLSLGTIPLPRCIAIASKYANQAFDNRVCDESLLFLFTFEEGQLASTATLVYDISLWSNLTLAMGNLSDVSWNSKSAGLSLHGSNSYIPLESTGSVNYIRQQVLNMRQISFTLETWTVISDINLGTQNSLLAFSSALMLTPSTFWENSVVSPMVSIVNSYGQVAAFISDSVVSDFLLGQSSTLQIQHAVLTVDEHQLSLYCNGVLFTFLSWSGNLSDLIPSNSKLLFAFDQDVYTGEPWQGSLNLVSMYNRALTAEEVLINYNAGLPNSLPILNETVQFFFVNETISSVLNVSTSNYDFDVAMENTAPYSNWITPQYVTVYLATLPPLNKGSLMFCNISTNASITLNTSMLPFALPSDSATYTLSFTSTYFTNQIVNQTIVSNYTSFIIYPNDGFGSGLNATVMISLFLQPAVESSSTGSSSSVSLSSFTSSYSSQPSSSSTNIASALVNISSSSSMMTSSSSSSLSSSNSTAISQGSTSFPSSSSLSTSPSSSVTALSSSTSSAVSSSDASSSSLLSSSSNIPSSTSSGNSYSSVLLLSSSSTSSTGTSPSLHSSTSSSSYFTSSSSIPSSSPPSSSSSVTSSSVLLSSSPPPTSSSGTSSSMLLSSSSPSTSSSSSVSSSYATSIAVQSTGIASSQPTSPAVSSNVAASSSLGTSLSMSSTTLTSSVSTTKSSSSSSFEPFPASSSSTPAVMNNSQITPPLAISAFVVATAGVPMLISLTGQDQDRSPPLHAPVSSVQIVQVAFSGSLYQVNSDGSMGSLIFAATTLTDALFRVWYLPSSGNLSLSGQAVIDTDKFSFNVMIKNTWSTTPGLIFVTVLNNVHSSSSEYVLEDNLPLSIVLMGGNDVPNEAYTFVILNAPQHGIIFLSDGVTPLDVVTSFNGSLVYITEQDRFAGEYNRSLIPTNDQFSFAVAAPNGLLSTPSLVSLSFAPFLGPPLLVMTMLNIDTSSVIVGVNYNCSVLVDPSNLQDAWTTLWLVDVTVSPSSALLDVNYATSLNYVVPDTLNMLIYQSQHIQFLGNANASNSVLSIIYFQAQDPDHFTVTVQVTNAAYNAITNQVQQVAQAVTNTNQMTSNRINSTGPLPFNSMWLWISIGILVMLLICFMLARKYLWRKKEPPIENECVQVQVIGKSKQAKDEEGTFKWAEQSPLPSPQHSNIITQTESTLHTQYNANNGNTEYTPSLNQPVPEDDTTSDQRTKDSMIFRFARAARASILGSGNEAHVAICRKVSVAEPHMEAIIPLANYGRKALSSSQVTTPLSATLASRFTFDPASPSMGASTPSAHQTNFLSHQQFGLVKSSTATSPSCRRPRMMLPIGEHLPIQKMAAVLDPTRVDTPRKGESTPRSCTNSPMQQTDNISNGSIASLDSEQVPDGGLPVSAVSDDKRSSLMSRTLPQEHVPVNPMVAFTAQPRYDPIVYNRELRIQQQKSPSSAVRNNEATYGTSVAHSPRSLLPENEDCRNSVQLMADLLMTHPLNSYSPTSH